eukprot:140405-Amphidinium_carterae.1
MRLELVDMHRASTCEMPTLLPQSLKLAKASDGPKRALLHASLAGPQRSQCHIVKSHVVWAALFRAMYAWAAWQPLLSENAMHVHTH